MRVGILRPLFFVARMGPNASADLPSKNSARGRLIAGAIVASVLAALVIAVQFKMRSDQRHFELRQAEEREKSVRVVQAGDDGENVVVFLDSRLIEMLAADPKCVANLKTLRLDMADLSGPETAAASKLVNVRRISFYNCTAANNLIAVMQGSSAVEEIRFEVTSLSDDGVRLLGTFPNLRRVHFQQIVDAERVKLLRRSLPGVELELPDAE